MLSCSHHSLCSNHFIWPFMDSYVLSVTVIYLHLWWSCFQTKSCFNLTDGGKILSWHWARRKNRLVINTDILHRYGFWTIKVWSRKTSLAQTRVWGKRKNKKQVAHLGQGQSCTCRVRFRVPDPQTDCSSPDSKTNPKMGGASVLLKPQAQSKALCVQQAEPTDTPCQSFKASQACLETWNWGGRMRAGGGSKKILCKPSQPLSPLPPSSFVHCFLGWLIYSHLASETRVKGIPSELTM